MTGASHATGEGRAEWAQDILRAVRELRHAVMHGPKATGDADRRLWESVRQLQTEVVNLQGNLLSPPKTVEDPRL